MAEKLRSFIDKQPRNIANQYPILDKNRYFSKNDWTHQLGKETSCRNVLLTKSYDNQMVSRVIRMIYTSFGKTGYQVSEIALGTWGISGSGWDENSEDVRLEAIQSAIESGINFIDTAPAYNGGIAEDYVGRVVQKMGVRDKVYIVTKCGTEFVNGKYIRSCAPSAILRECETSLKISARII